MTTLQSFKIAHAATLAAQAAKAARIGASKATVYTQLNVCLVAHGQKTVEFKRLQSAPLCTEPQLIAYLLQSGYTLQTGYYVADDASHAIIASRGLVAVCYRDNTGKWQIVNDVFNRYLVLRLRAKVAKNPVPVAVPATATATVSRTIAVCESKAAEFVREVAVSVTPATCAPIATDKNKALRAIDVLCRAAKSALAKGNELLLSTRHFDIVAKHGRFFQVVQTSTALTTVPFGWGNADIPATEYAPIFADGVAVHDTRGLARYLSGLGV